MLIRTVKDLKVFLKSNSLTPEQFAPSVQLSHMTIRRLLRESDRKKISPKYYANFDAVSEPRVSDAVVGDFLPGDTQDFGVIMKELEAKGQAVTDVNVVGEEMSKKFKFAAVGKGLRSRLETLFQAVTDKTTPAKARLLALGAILYFVDPLDIIPDVVVGVGYIDDFTIISLALGAIIASRKNLP